ncbi:MAG TPA: hypothetical protein VIY28_10785 [Pseudonocardiaceae bacterium]
MVPYGGAIEASATVVFGAYFMAASVVAFLAIRERDIARHRRWMISVALGVGTIRGLRGRDRTARHRHS